MAPATVQRDYASIEQIVGPQARGRSRDERMSIVVDGLWEALHDKQISWVGFYVAQPNEPPDRRLVLGPCRNKPACSPIGMHGVCGQALIAGATRIVRDVKELGSNYIACDPRDRSEIVIPLVDELSRCWGVLDVDSWQHAAFDERDESGLRQVLLAAGLGGS